VIVGGYMRLGISTPWRPGHAEAVEKFLQEIEFLTSGRSSYAPGPATPIVVEASTCSLGAS